MYPAPFIQAAMTWAQRLKRIFGIDIETCPACGGAVRFIACIEDPAVIKKILAHLDRKDVPQQTLLLPQGGRRLLVDSADLTYQACSNRLLCCCAGHGRDPVALTPGASGAEMVAEEGFLIRWVQRARSWGDRRAPRSRLLLNYPR
jgi:hypothetical protein